MARRHVCLIIVVLEAPLESPGGIDGGSGWLGDVRVGMRRQTDE